MYCLRQSALRLSPSDTHSALDLLTRSGNVEQYSLTALLTFLKSHHPQHLNRVVVVGAASDQDFALKIDQLNSFLTSEVHVVVAAAETHQRSRSWQRRMGRYRGSRSRE